MLTKNTALSVTIFCCISAYAMETKQPVELQQINCQSSHELGNISVVSDGTSFFVQKNHKLIKVEPCSLDQTLRTMNKKHLEAFQKCGYVSVNKLGKNEYSLKSHVRGLGGGPTTCWAAYCTTKAIGYVTYAAAVWNTGGEAMIHHHEILAAIETAAQTAAYLGAISPTP